MEIKWSKAALKDLESIQNYILSENESIFFEVLDYIFEKVEVYIPKYKHLGRAGRVLGTRELVLSQYPYIIVYTVKNDCLYMVRILHTSIKYPK